MSQLSGPQRAARYDPERAAYAERQLAAVTDAELVADIREAARLVDDLAERWRRPPQWRDNHPARAAYAAAKATHAALAALADDAPVRAAVAAAHPVLGLSWPTAPPLAGAVGVAVDQLRYAAMHRPELVRHCRNLAVVEASPLWRRILPDPPPPGPWAPTPDQAAAFALWLDLSTGLLPALAVAEIRPGEIAEEVDGAVQGRRARLGIARPPGA